MNLPATVLTNDEEIDAAIERGELLPERPSAISAEYNSELDVVIVRLDNGRRLVIQREKLQGLGDASAAQLADIEIFAGVNIGWRQLNVDHYLPSLIEGRFGSEKWMQALKRDPIAA